MTSPTSIKNAEHYTWGKNCDGWHLLKTDSLSVIQEKIPSGAAEQKHYHTHAQQLFYVLKGVARFEIEEEIVLVQANEGIHIPKGTKHCVSNQGIEDLEFLAISEPKSHGDRQNL
ncbi:MAG: cupin domain-containing protein [Bacteroidetes bacterium HGW-Bacteroidetes-21]|jgi:mannose-6-phosphate isomerase-like protein (cupin superfamily)|nr:MAG: cupin domain-containing protein [Bacteroidetes bacterium HGW-Bacteroidetes-21]